MPDDTLIGFDGTTDDTVIIMRRNPDGTWQVQPGTTGHNEPHTSHIAQLVAEHFPPPATPAPPVPLAEQIREWLERFADTTFTVTPEQIAWLEKVYADATRTPHPAPPRR